MKFFKNKFVIGIFCLILALVVVVMVMPKNTGKTVDVIKLNNTVDANTQITDNMVRKVTIPEDANVSGAITEKEKVVGKYTTTQIYKDDFIVDGKLSDSPTNSNLYALNNGEEAISITVKDLASCVTGKLIEGDVVSIYYYDTTEKKVIENETQTSIRQLDEKESIDELARILGGAKITQMVLDSAKEMRQLAKNARGHGFQNEPE